MFHYNMLFYMELHLVNQEGYKDDLLIVTHGAPIVGIIQELVDREKEVSCPLCSLFKVVKTDRRWVLELNGDTSHLIHTEKYVRLH